MLSKFGLVPWNSDIAQPGKEFGRLTVLATGKEPGTYKYYAICKCSCGSDPKAIRIDHLRKGTVVSCGCNKREQSTKHGNWQHPLYHVWDHMMQRCYNPKSERYYAYGARGITVCDRWHDLNSFIHDMYPSFSPGLQIDRIDNDKGYSPENCRWASRGAQQLNTTRSLKITYQGKTLCLSEWSRLLGISYGTLWERLTILKWLPERAFTIPPLSSDDRCLLARTARWDKKKP